MISMQCSVLPSRPGVPLFLAQHGRALRGPSMRASGRVCINANCGCLEQVVGAGTPCKGHPEFKKIPLMTNSHVVRKTEDWGPSPC